NVDAGGPRVRAARTGSRGRRVLLDPVAPGGDLSVGDRRGRAGGLRRARNVRGGTRAPARVAPRRRSREHARRPKGSSPAGSAGRTRDTPAPRSARRRLDRGVVGRVVAAPRGG